MKRNVVLAVLGFSLTVIILLSAFVWYFADYQNQANNPSPTPTPTPTPTLTPTATPTPTPAPPTANVYLSSDQQIVALSSFNEPKFTLTITQTGNSSLQFPCIFECVSSNFPYTVRGFRLENYGKYDLGDNTQHMFLIPSSPKSVSYYVVVWDSNENRIESNRIIGHTGIGNIPNIVERDQYSTESFPNATNIDRHPLMYPYDIENSIIARPTSELFPTSLVIASIASVAVIGVGLLVFFKKRKQRV
jgi:hypothetical protein